MVKNFDLDKWKTQLQEGNTNNFQNFEIQNNKGEYKICNHQYKLVFAKATIAKEHDLPAIPFYKYDFTSFGDLLTGDASPVMLIGNLI